MEDSQKYILIQKIKRKCYITDESSLIENRLNDIVEDAIIKVSDLIGLSDYDFDFSISSAECELFKNYCFYMWNDKSVKEFEEAYISDILKLRHKYLIASNEEDVNDE